MQTFKAWADVHNTQYIKTPMNNGYSWQFGPFENGFGASVIRHEYSYGYNQGLFELAVLHDDNNVLCYSTPITDDVIGYQTEMQIVNLLYQIIALPASPDCTHKHPSLISEED